MKGQQKPINNHHCPNCKVGFAIPELATDEYKPFAFYPKFCYECGQALDWSEKNEV